VIRGERRDPEPRLLEMEGYRLRLVPTTKFKTSYFQLRFSAPFRPETLNLRALLPYALLDGTATLPTKRLFQNRCDRLYGAQVGAGVAKQGMMSVVTFSLSVVNDHYLPGDARVLDEALDLFHDVVLRPRTYRGLIRAGVVKDEVRLLREDIEADYADKAEYAFQRMSEAMFKDELARYRAKGDYDTLDKVTPEGLTEAYRDMLANDFVEAVAVGDFDSDEIARAFSRRFAFSPRPTVPVWTDTETKDITDVQRVVEEGDVSQARLVLGYRLPTRSGSKDYYAAVVGNALFGDSDTSMLFRTVREKEHLCYYVYSVYAAGKGAVFVSAGVEPGREDQASAVIGRVKDDLAAGRFSEDDLTIAKNAVVKRMRQSTDSLRGIVADHAHFDRLYGIPYDLDRAVAAVQAVTAEAVAAQIALLIEDTEYRLTGRNR